MGFADAGLYSSNEIAVLSMTDLIRENLDAFLGLMDLAAGAGDSAENVFEQTHRLRASKPMQLCLKRLAQHPESQALIERRYGGGSYDSAALRALPQGTLGHTYATVMEVMGYDINFFPKPEFFASLEIDADYVNYRATATHDLHHILSSFSLNNFGELGVISISVAQFSHPGSAFLDLMALLLSWFRSDTPIDQLETIQEQARSASYAYKMIGNGLEMGLNAKPLFPVIWEERWEHNLDELRAELGIVPALDGPWSWASNEVIRQALGW
jgi:ubiquinone biosynthesis protein COQ4